MTVTLQPLVVLPSMVVGAVSGGVVRVDPVPHFVTGAHELVGHRGLPGVTQSCGQATARHAVLVV